MRCELENEPCSYSKPWSSVFWGWLGQNGSVLFFTHRTHLQSVIYLCFFGRVFPVKDVPTEPEALTHWLYQRFIEKEDLLTHFYETGRIRFSEENWAFLVSCLTRISK